MNICKKYLISIIVFIISFSACEIILFSFSLSSTTESNTLIDNYHFIPGSKIVCINEGYSVREVNKLGFPDREYSHFLEENTLRILLFGNSFSEAIQMPTNKTYENILEDTLQMQLKRKVEIWNLAKSGAGLLDNLASSKKVIYDIDYDYIFIQISKSNIFNIHISGSNVIVHDDSIVNDPDILKKKTFLTIFNQKFREKSITWNLLMTRMYIFSRFISRLKIKHFLYKKNNEAQNDLDMQSASKNKLTTENKEYFAYLISILSHQIQIKHAKLILFTFPQENDIELVDFYKEVCRKNNATYLDLSKYKQLSDTTGYPIQGFFNSKLGYGHLNEYGNKVLAHVLDEELLPILSADNKINLSEKYMPQ